MVEDSDGDGVAHNEDNCPDVANHGQEDADENGIGDACDGPSAADGGGDEDGVDDADNNCLRAKSVGVGELRLRGRQSTESLEIRAPTFPQRPTYRRGYPPSSWSFERIAATTDASFDLGAQP